MKKDAAKSIKAKLLSIARNGQLNYQLLVIRYLHERLLYRLSVSGYRNKFCLKGGALLYAFEKEFPRPTLDIDFLGMKIENDLDSIKNVFAEILAIKCEIDGVSFEVGTIKTEAINESKAYRGIRVICTAHMDSIRQVLKTDIGFGDIITPAAQNLSYPTLVKELPAPSIVAYSLETVVAEKFQAMIDLSEVNSRYKDFYDIYKILETQKLDETVLREAIHATFKNRQTSYQERHPLFAGDFAKDAKRSTQWKRFLKKMKQDEDLAFETVMSLITDRLQPIFETLKP